MRKRTVLHFWAKNSPILVFFARKRFGEEEKNAAQLRDFYQDCGLQEGENVTVHRPK